METQTNKKIKILSKHDISTMLEKGKYFYKNWYIESYKPNAYSTKWSVKNPMFEGFYLELPTLQEAYKFINFAEFLIDEIK